MNRKKKAGPGDAKVSRKGSGSLCKLHTGLAGQRGGGGQLPKRDMGLAGQSGGSGQLCKLDMGLAGQSEEAASCANWSWGWRAKVEIDQGVEVHSKVFVVASKCVSGNDFG